MPRSSSSSLTRALTRAPTSTACSEARRSRRTSMTTDRRSRESGGPAAFAMSEEQRDSRFRGNDQLGKPMIGDRCRAQPFSEEQRDALRTACAEDGEIWQIYANNFGPDGFDASIDRYISNRG